MIVPHHNEELAAWITVNAETGEWVLVFGPVKHDVCRPERRTLRVLGRMDGAAGLPSPQRTACRGRRMTEILILLGWFAASALICYLADRRK